MQKLVTVVGKNGVEYTVPLTGEQADYYLRLAQLRAVSHGNVMKEFSTLIIDKCQQDSRQGKAQYN